MKNRKNVALFRLPLYTLSLPLYSLRWFFFFLSYSLLSTSMLVTDVTGNTRRERTGMSAVKLQLYPCERILGLPLSCSSQFRLTYVLALVRGSEKEKK
jgi:hypothetical protein